MLRKPIESITASDLLALVHARYSERKVIEYKEYLPGRAPREKDVSKAANEFLADVTSFANASGGDIIYGIVDERDADNIATGCPAEVVGVASANLGEEKQRLRNMLADSIAPRMLGVEIEEIGSFERGPAIVVRIPRSWNRPHMIAAGASRFYSRDGAGKRPLDVTQIRDAFIQSRELAGSIRQFRDDRIGSIVAGEGALPLAGTGFVCLHILPLVCFESDVQLDLGALAIGSSALLHPMGGMGFDHFVNFDGVVRHLVNSYLQIFRSGILEALDTNAFVRGDRSVLPTTYIEEHLIQAVADYFDALEDVISVYPATVAVTLIGVKGRGLGPAGCATRPIDRDVLALPQIMVDGLIENVGAKMRPVFDAMWQASGVIRSPNYDRDGNWKALV